ncbi:MAG: hypothetical protein M3Q88_00990, partial [Pseudomonadota bacterium]|nr:hypothetical protein [Pseudomonadota bacterium]
MKIALPILLAAGVAGAALAQSRPESILPPGFGEPAPPPPPPPSRPTPPADAPSTPAAPANP